MAGKLGQFCSAKVGPSMVLQMARTVLMHGSMTSRPRAPLRTMEPPRVQPPTPTDDLHAGEKNKDWDLGGRGG